MKKERAVDKDGFPISDAKLVYADGTPIPKKVPPKVVTGTTLLEKMEKAGTVEPPTEIIEPVPPNVKDTKDVYVPNDLDKKPE
jgi:hypothetical protein